MDLLQLRTSIDEIDSQITDLIIKRMQLVGEIAKYKAKHN
ncbi:MAG TPA: chorismate mutase, partial [Bacillota bacterium]|nr:chorismate mutase [Bacillota bacterium]